MCTVHFDEIFCFKKVEIQKFREIYYIILLFLTRASRNKILYPERNHSFLSGFAVGQEGQDSYIILHVMIFFP